jgi:gliding motility-associated-like protein
MAPVAFPYVTITKPDCLHNFGSILFTGGWAGHKPFKYSIDNGASFSQDSLFDHLPAGTYSAIVRDAGGCELPFSLQLPAVAPISITLPANITVDAGQTVQITPVLNITASAIASIVWTPSTGLDCANCLSPIATPATDIAYQVVVTGASGCLDSARIAIHVNAPSGVYIPNIFSPNGDGINDQFVVNTTLTISKFEMQVFDRWGDLVYDGHDVARGWDGTAKGQPQNPGVYVYWIKMDFINGKGEMEQKLWSGDVSLLR